ncbi:hypothetical protein GGI25_005495 [Coemansia spiralis]|uniref:Uncharacterized protein n=2 Tax=Coemansia TaxID=4863 RepID=A0A9W8G2J2_9FUNG|nr:hypothetical protein BX070DRAFT_255244 [Coemansia spiralis]KAJ1995303.1 hypothetical protein EDC05_001141 [Coemansia umbellata]KAJ2619488.1 hypothetical protein GGI26_005789 [Coemansia sp. RSA 1358]KAJ2671481.1 hypothetical protein GGI25_005495 [Coemansia spiralis]
MNALPLVFVIVGLFLILILAFIYKMYRVHKRKEKEAAVAPEEEEAMHQPKEAAYPQPTYPNMPGPAYYSQYPSMPAVSSTTAGPREHNRFTLTVNDSAVDPWAALGGIEALTAQRQEQQQYRMSQMGGVIPPVPPIPNNIRSTSSPSIAPMARQTGMRPSNSSTSLQAENRRRNRETRVLLPQQDPHAGWRQRDSYIPGDNVRVNRSSQRQSQMPPPSYDSVMLGRPI